MGSPDVASHRRDGSASHYPRGGRPKKGANPADGWAGYAGLTKPRGRSNECLAAGLGPTPSGGALGLGEDPSGGGGSREGAGSIGAKEPAGQGIPKAPLVPMRRNEHTVCGAGTAGWAAR